MPLLSPNQIHQVLRNENVAAVNEPKNLKKLLEDSNLTAPEVLDNLSSLMRSAEQDSTRMKAAETALKLNGLLSGDTQPDFNVTIIIQDSEFSVNPILIPRQ